MTSSNESLISMIAMRKHAGPWSEFKKRTNHVGSIIGSAQLHDDDGRFLVGTTLEIELRAPIITDQCLIYFTIMKLSGRVRSRQYQLEICPREKRSHNGVIPLYGPHEHIGDDEPTSVEVDGVECGDWDRSLTWFSKRINLQNFWIDKPC